MKNENLVKQKDKMEVVIQDKARLIASIYELKEEVDNVISKLEGMTKSPRNLNSGTEPLDAILMVGNMTRDM